MFLTPHQSNSTELQILLTMKTRRRLTLSLSRIVLMISPVNLNLILVLAASGKSWRQRVYSVSLTLISILKQRDFVQISKSHLTFLEVEIWCKIHILVYLNKFEMFSQTRKSLKFNGQLYYTTFSHFLISKVQPLIEWDYVIHLDLTFLPDPVKMWRGRPLVR